MIDINYILKNFKIVIFDMDGVLIDSYEMHKVSWNTIASRFGSTLNDEEFKKIFGLTSSEGVRAVEKLKGWESETLDTFVFEVDEHFRKMVKNDTLLINGSIDFVRELKANQMPTAIATSAPKENANVFLDSLKINELFDFIISGDDVKKGKPDPEIYLKTADHFKIHPNDCVVFEDSLMGINSAKDAGMYCIGIASTHEADELSKADFVIKDFNYFKNIQE